MTLTTIRREERLLGPEGIRGPCKGEYQVFLTGSNRIPINGMSSVQIIIQSTATGEEYLPVAHTCYNLFDLPKYSSKEIMKARLTQALDNYEGFSLA